MILWDYKYLQWNSNALFISLVLEEFTSLFWRGKLQTAAFSGEKWICLWYT
jgi:hypothetical protein